ncbi:MAG: ribbon-helix-helix domain-containing protein [archaeon]
MAHISIRLGKELEKQVGGAINEFHYHTKADFVRDAIRLKIKELSVERKKENAWHKLLSTHKKLNEVKKTWIYWGTTNRKVQRRHLTLKDLLKHQYQPGQTKITMI